MPICSDRQHSGQLCRNADKTRRPRRFLLDDSGHQSVSSKVGDTTAAVATADYVDKFDAVTRAINLGSILLNYNSINSFLFLRVSWLVPLF